MASALAKKQRGGMSGEEAEGRIWNAFQSDLRSDRVASVPLDEGLVAHASALVRDLVAREGLCTLDALQLAAAMTRRQALFLSSDQRLTKIAALIGLDTPPFKAQQEIRD